jgi:hypothetical protein
LTTLDQRRALALRIAKTIGRDPASIVAALRSRLDTSFKFNPRQRRDDHGRWSDGGPSVPNMPSGPNFGGGGHDYVKGGKQQTIRYKVGNGSEKSITGRVIRERPDSISVVKRGRPDSATEIIQKKHIIHEGEVKPRAGTFIGNVPETHKNARPQGDGIDGPTRADNTRRMHELQDKLEGDEGLSNAEARELKSLESHAKINQIVARATALRKKRESGVKLTPQEQEEDHRLAELYRRWEDGQNI